MKKYQSSLNSFLGIQDQDCAFHLDWENKTATWTDKRPLGVLWEHEFLWGKTRFITSTLKSSNNDQSIKDKYPKSMIPLLKSHLQKCTRRSHSMLAVKTAKHLMNLDLNVFLRRWTIILLEDSMINFNYTLLVWIMVAVSKGYYPCQEILEWILGTVEATVNYPFKLDFSYDRVQKLKLKGDTDLINALKIRKDYGGLKCDAVMIENIIETFMDSTDEYGNLTKTMIENLSFQTHSVDYNGISDLELEEWELAAVDFHVSDIIEKWFAILSNEDKEKWTRDDLKSCMWECSGSINHRIKQNSCWSLWARYSNRVEKMAGSILLKKFNWSNLSNFSDSIESREDPRKRENKKFKFQ